MRQSLAPHVTAVTIALLTSGCVLPGQETGGAGGGDPSGAGGGDVELTDCEERSDGCALCAQCAAAGACAELVNACGYDAECSTLDQCLGLCGGEPECADGCYMQYPGAIELHGRAMGCVYCDQCANDCGANPACI